MLDKEKEELFIKLFNDRVKITTYNFYEYYNPIYKKNNPDGRVFITLEEFCQKYPTGLSVDQLQWVHRHSTIGANKFYTAFTHFQGPTKICEERFWECVYKAIAPHECLPCG